MTWGFLLVLLGFLDSRSQESSIGIGTGHRLATDFSNFCTRKGGTQSFGSSSKRRGSTSLGVSRILRYWKEVRVILSTDRGLVVLRFVREIRS